MRANELESTGSCKLWEILARDDFVLGKVCWYSPWRQYVFEPEPRTLFNATCLTELRTFLSAEMTKKLRPTAVRDEIDAISTAAEVRRLGLTGEGEGLY